MNRHLRSRKRFSIAVVTFGISTGFIGPAIADAGCPVPDPQDLDVQNKNGSFVLESLRNQQPPYDSFYIWIDRDGRGHFKSWYVSPNQKVPFLREWEDSTSYFNKDKGWTQLTLQDAKELWGEPKKYTFNNYPFYIFDAYSTWNGEKNLYHLDLAFSDDGFIKGYRIRGIGISHPQWIKNPIELDEDHPATIRWYRKQLNLPERDETPGIRPAFFKAEWLSKEFPSKENVALSAWCQSAEDQFSQLFREQKEWKQIIQHTDCTFLVSSHGAIKDPFICLGHDSYSRAFVLSLRSQKLIICPTRTSIFSIADLSSA